MARLSRWAIFVRVFLVTLLMGQVARSEGADDAEQSAWRSAESIGTAAAYYAFLSRFPASAYADEAVEKLKNLGAMKSTRATRSLPSLGKGKSKPAVKSSETKETRSVERDTESDRFDRSRESDPY